MEDSKEIILNKEFINSSTEIREIKNKIESALYEIIFTNKFHFKNFDTSVLKIRESSSNYVIDQHEETDPTKASNTAIWNEEHWTKVVDLMHREKFKNWFWDAEVPIVDKYNHYGNVDLILANNKSGDYFSKLTIVELKSSEEARLGLKHALYYAHLLNQILKNIIPNLEISIVLLTFPKAKTTEEKIRLSKEMLVKLKKDIKEIRNEYRGIVSDIKIIEMIAPGTLPALKPNEEVIIPPNISFVFHREENDSPIISTSLEEFLS
jgi:hypothetical protein